MMPSQRLQDNPLRTAASNHRSWIHFLWSGIILIGSLAWYESEQAQLLRKEVAQLRNDNATLQVNVTKSDESLQQALNAFHDELDQFHEEFVHARRETGQNLADAQAAALKHADALAQQLEVKRKQQEAQQKQLSAELNKVKESTADTSTRLNGISSDVGAVREEVESAHSATQETRGDVSKLSHGIATNASEIKQLREQGDRNIYEFTLTKSNMPQRVGDIQVVLDKTDAKHNHFTVEILAADQRVEKRDKTINEPVQFYVPGKGSQPYEFVVNEVGKNSIKGYLSTPHS
jgi:chromosome segregation ATPase